MSPAQGSTVDVVVIGGGVVGCAVAYFLSREQLSVRILERDDLAMHASGAAAGMLRPMGEHREDGAFFKWGLRSLALFPELTEELRERSGVDPEYVASGVLDVTRTEDGARALHSKARGLVDHDVVWLDAAEARIAEPQLAEDIVGAMWSPREAHVRSPLLARAFAAAAVQLGAKIETGVSALGFERVGSRITGVRTSAGLRHASHVVLCTGAWSAACAGWLGAQWELPIVPLRGQIVALDAPSPPLRTIVVGEGAYLVPKQDGSVVVGATEEPVGFDCRVTAAGVARLLDAAPRSVPALAASTFRGAWAGLRPASPDHLPLIGPLPGFDGLLLAAGHHRNGVLLSPITGQLVTGWVLGKGLPEDAAAFRPDRFLDA